MILWYHSFLIMRKNKMHPWINEMQKKFFITRKWMKDVNKLDDKTLSELRDLLIRICKLVSDITTVNEVSNYVLKYNCRLPYTKHDINLMRSIEDQVLTWLVDISDEFISNNSLW